jgi:hypothetical protein
MINIPLAIVGFGLTSSHDGERLPRDQPSGDARSTPEIPIAGGRMRTTVPVLQPRRSSAKPNDGLFTNLLTNRSVSRRTEAHVGDRSPRSRPDIRSSGLSMAWKKVAKDTVALQSAEAGRHPTTGASRTSSGSCPPEATDSCPVGRLLTSRFTGPASSSSATWSSATSTCRSSRSHW